MANSMINLGLDYCPTVADVASACRAHFGVIPNVSHHMHDWENEYCTVTVPHGQERARKYIVFMNERTRHSALKRKVFERIETLCPFLLVRYMGGSVTGIDVAEVQTLPCANRVINALITDYDRMCDEVLTVDKDGRNNFGSCDGRVVIVAGVRRAGFVNKMFYLYTMA